MPVEVRELIIKATVAPEATQGSSRLRTTSNNSVSPTEEIVKTCVEKVLKILNDKRER